MSEKNQMIELLRAMAALPRVWLELKALGSGQEHHPGLSLEQRVGELEQMVSALEAQTPEGQLMGLKQVVQGWGLEPLSTNEMIIDALLERAVLLSSEMLFKLGVPLAVLLQKALTTAENLVTQALVMQPPPTDGSVSLAAGLAPQLLTWAKEAQPLAASLMELLQNIQNQARTWKG